MRTEVLVQLLLGSVVQLALLLLGSNLVKAVLPHGRVAEATTVDMEVRREDLLRGREVAEVAAAVQHHGNNHSKHHGSNHNKLHGSSSLAATMLFPLHHHQRTFLLHHRHPTTTYLHLLHQLSRHFTDNTRESSIENEGYHNRAGRQVCVWSEYNSSLALV